MSSLLAAGSTPADPQAVVRPLVRRTNERARSPRCRSRPASRPGRPRSCSPRADAPAVALDDAGQISLGFADDANVGVFKGSCACGRPDGLGEDAGRRLQRQRGRSCVPPTGATSSGQRATSCASSRARRTSTRARSTAARSFRTTSSTAARARGTTSRGSRRCRGSRRGSTPATRSSSGPSRPGARLRPSPTARTSSSSTPSRRRPPQAP